LSSFNLFKISKTDKASSLNFPLKEIEKCETAWLLRR